MIEVSIPSMEREVDESGKSKKVRTLFTPHRSPFTTFTNSGEDAVESTQPRFPTRVNTCRLRPMVLSGGVEAVWRRVVPPGEPGYLHEEWKRTQTVAEEVAAV